MSFQEVSPEQFAELFHHYHRVLAGDFGCESKPTFEAWEHVPLQEKSRIVAATRLALMELAASDRERRDSRRYFAEPGKAEWGC